ncbi:single-stranded-DNA-specific exonuclease RecJ [Cetobacterium sp. 8H]|uniref:single-stranded-DNA-specific exonuclease RecJ n=1 Tax=Cetobacterium sp. 8H TaxID=2759681 RepID=UPI00163CDA9B|nr:single-stranded-DNA-specific exonuclease RecJ [Cetobacterium sp. 8H]MBC2851524.1 single-stranded-DNA-specific exonuclease RecJ [Cetobacterium sp. 8H]
MHWEYKTVSENLIETKASQWDVSEFLATLLLKKGFLEKDDVHNFLNPSIDKLRNPFDFEVMDRVVEKIVSAKNNGEKLYIYGDYDVDGITAAIFLVLAFREIGIDIDYYIPNRMDEGYGLDKKTIDFIHQNLGKLIITVDTGINSREDVEYARTLGIDVIVTDHHKSVKDDEEEDLLFINPKLSEHYQFKFLAGAGVALKVAQAVYSHLNEDFSKLYQFLDVVMIGTVADVVPMFDENRIIISKGLETLKNTKIKGLVYLMKYLKLYNKDISTTDISYFVSPLINSLGRLGNSKLGADFFMKTDDFEIYNIIEEMKKSNKQRRELERVIFDEANSMVQKKGTEHLKYIFVASEKWHPGVIGVVASRLSVKYDLPVAMISLKDGVAKASCRSIPGVNIFNILKLVENKLIRFGGHDLAAGFIANQEELPYIESFFEKEIQIHEHSNKQTKTLEIDLELPIEKIDKDIIQDIKKLGPFGLENRHPYFLDKGVKITDTKFFGIENRHFNGFLIKNGKSFPLVAFDLSSKLLKSSKNAVYDIVYYPEKIINRGEEFYQFRLKDLKAQKA